MAEQKRTTCFEFMQAGIKNWPAFVLSMSLALGIPGCDAAKPKKKVIATDGIEVLQPQEKIALPPQAAIATIQPQAALPVFPQQTPMPVQRPAQIQSLPKLPTLTQQQIDAGWTPAKVATVEQYRQNIKEFRGGGDGVTENVIQNALNTLSPIQVGEHIICDNTWLEFIGTDKNKISPQAFEMWIKRMDMAYKSFKELTGQSPRHGEVVFISIQPKESFANRIIDGKAYPEYNMLRINRNGASFRTYLQEIALHNSCTRVALHELTHMFAAGREWETYQESIGNVLIAYAMETNPEIQFGGAVSGTKAFGLRKTIGNQYRYNAYQLAWEIRNMNGVKHIKNVNDIYLMGLVGKVNGEPAVAWEVYKKVFQSYHSPDQGFIPNEYEGDKYSVQTLDFLHRLEYFSGKPGILRSLDDKGALLARLDTRMIKRNLQPVGNNVQVADRTR